MIAKAAAVAISDLFNIVKFERRVEGERHQMMAAQLEGRRRAVAEGAAKEQNLDRMRAQTQARLGISLAQSGMGYNPMLSGGGGGAEAAPFIAWSARRG
jgi:hypothetical protein